MEIKLALIHDLAVVKSAICRHVIVGLHDTRIHIPERRMMQIMGK